MSGFPLTDNFLSDLMTLGLVVSRFNQGRDGTLYDDRLLADTYQQIEVPEVHSRPRLQALFAELDRTVGILQTACGLTADQVRAFPLLAAARP